MSIETNYIWIRNWISRAVDSVEPISKFDFESHIPRILKYGKYFRLLNNLNGNSEISFMELTEKAWSYNIEGAQSIDLIEELKKLDIVQFSSDRTIIQFLKSFSPYEIFYKILKEESFGSLSPMEIIILEIFIILRKKRFLTFETLLDEIKRKLECNEEQLKYYINFLKNNNLLDVISSNDGIDYLFSRISNYGDYNISIRICQKSSSDELDLVGEAIEYIDKNVGIPDNNIPVKLQQGIELCIDNGIIHPVRYNFGTSEQPQLIELLFPATEEFSINPSECGQFDKIQAAAGMLIYSTKISNKTIRMPDRFVDSIISGEIRVRNQYKDMFRQYSPMIYAGMINFKHATSDYLTRYGNLSTYSGLKPILLNTEENRDTLRKALQIIEKNDDYLKPSSIQSIQESTIINYEDTAGKMRTLERKNHIFDILLNKAYRKGD